MSVAGTAAVSDRPLPKTDESPQEKSQFLSEDQIFTFPGPLISGKSNSATSGISSLLSTTPALNTPIASYGVPYTPSSTESFTASLSSLDKFLPLSLKSETCESMAGAISTLPSAFPVSTNPFVNTLTSPFLPHNLFLPHPLASPVFDNALHLRNSWKIIDAYTRLSGGDTPSRGLPLPTPLFSDLLLSPFGSLVGPAAAPEPSSATPAGSPTLHAVERSVKEERPSSPGAAPSQLQALLQSSSRRQEARESCKTDQDSVLEGREYKVRWGEQAQRVCEHVAASCGDSRTSDVTLVGSDGASVAVHSLVMASASPLLRRALQDVKGDQPAVVVVPGASAAMLEAIVSVCYRGSICLDKALVPHVLKIAQALEITQLLFDDPMSPPSGSIYSTPAGSSPQSPKVKAPLPILPKPSYTSPSPPAVFTFTPPIPQHSPPPYSTALASSISAKTPGKRRPLTPDLAQTEQRAKKVKTGATFLPAEMRSSLSFSPVTPSKPESVKRLSLSASPSPVPSSPFSSVSQSGPSCVRDVRVVPDIVGMGGTSSRVLLWKFLLQLLHDGRFCPVYIRWLDRSNGVFRIMESDMVAQLWGLARKNSNMNYEKMSRGMRTYYKRGILYHIDGTKLIYKFNTSDGEVQQHMRYFEMTQQHDDTSSDNSMSTPGPTSVDGFPTGSCSDSGEATLVPLSLENALDLKPNFGNFSEKSAFAQPSSLPLTEDSKPSQSILGASLGRGSASSRNSGRSTPMTPRAMVPSFPGVPPLTTYSALPNLTMHALKRSQQHPLGSASSKTPKLPSALKSSIKKLEQFGLNKPRSNSIPNFQSSSRFPSFFHPQDFHVADALPQPDPRSDGLPHTPNAGADLHSDDDSRSQEREMSLSHPAYGAPMPGHLGRPITSDT